MVNVDKLQKRVTALQQERAALQAAIADLETGRAAKHQALQELWAAAERTPTDESTTAADRAEQEYDALGRQVERKRAALEACAADLGKAQADLGQAERGAVVAELQDLCDQAEKAAQRVDADIADAEAWGELHTLVQRANALYWTRLGVNGYGKFQWIFADPPDKLRGRLFGVHAERCDRTMAGHPVGTPVTMAELLHLDHAQMRIRSLKP